MLLTWSSAVIGLATLTVIGTVLPFSTSGGISSLTLPVRTGASPTRLRIAALSIAGVASTERVVTMGTAPPTAALPARPRNLRRVVVGEWRITIYVVLFTKRCKVGHDIFDLRSGEDRLAVPARSHSRKTVHAIIGRHDRGRIEMRSVDQPQAKLALAPAAARVSEAGRKVALEPGFGK